MKIAYPVSLKKQKDRSFLVGWVKRSEPIIIIVGCASLHPTYFFILNMGKFENRRFSFYNLAEPEHT